MFYDEKIETMPVEELKKLQLAKLKKAVEYAYNNSKFYKNMFVFMSYFFCLKYQTR